jgi:hypothetical protein
MMPPGIRPGESPTFYNLGEYVFQELCRDLFDAEPGISSCEIYGVRGQSQDGIDLIAHRRARNGIEVGQCKCYKDFPPREIHKASDEFFAHWDRWSQENVKRFILFVACDLNRTQQQDEIIKQKKYFVDYGIEYEAWSAAKIRNKLRPYPSIVETYCDPADYWVQAICGAARPVSPSTGTREAQTLISVDTALINQLGQLATWVSSEIKQRLDAIRAGYREGRRDEATIWLKELKDDVAVWSVLSPEVKAKLLCFEAGLELDLRDDLNRAKQLVDEAQALLPADNQARLRALMAYKESGPEAALELLEGQEDVDSLNLKASLLLEMGRVEESLVILNFEEIGLETNGET